MKNIDGADAATPDTAVPYHRSHIGEVCVDPVEDVSFNGEILVAVSFDLRAS